MCKILGLPKSAIMDALELVGLTQYKDRLAKKIFAWYETAIGTFKCIDWQTAYPYS